MVDAVRACQGRCGHSSFLGVCEQKQVLSTFLKCHCCNTFTVTSLEGGEGWLSHWWCAGSGSSVQPAWALSWGQLGFLTSVCCHNCPLHLAWPWALGRAHSLVYAQDFFTGWLGALFLQSQRGAVSRAYNTCAKSQVSKWNKHKLHEQLSVQLCSCRVEAVLFQFKFGYGREQRHWCGTLSLKNYQVVLYFYSKWLLSGFFVSKILSGGGCLWTYQQVVFCSCTWCSLTVQSHLCSRKLLVFVLWVIQMSLGSPCLFPFFSCREVGIY